MNDLSPASESEPHANKTWILILFVIVFFLLLGSFVGLYLYNKQARLTAPSPQETLEAPVNITNTPTARISPTLTPVQASPSAAQIRVLNGSGTAGSAQAIAAALRSEGFARLTVGNANNFTYQGITIQVTSEGSQYLPLVRDTITQLEPTASVTTTVTETITGDVVVIVGR